jgi:hypothetical protein
MATKKKGLPEITVSAPDHSNIVRKAKEALAFRSQLADLTAKEAESKEAVANLAKIIRIAEEADQNNYIGLIRITDPDMTPCQVQFKMSGGALALEEEDTLNAHFGAGRPLLFEKDMVVTGVINPDALIAEIRARGQNPWDVLEIKVKKNLDQMVATSEHVTKEEAYLPKEGFLATLNEIKHTLGDKAKEYVTRYLIQVLKPTVDLGKK